MGTVVTLGVSAQVDLIISGAVIVACIAVIVVAARYALKWKRRDLKPQWAALETRAMARYEREGGRGDEPQVLLDFYTYRGFLSVFQQTRHRRMLPAPLAVAVAEELHRYNLRSCLILYAGVVFVPALSWVNLQKIRRAARKATGA